VLAACTGCRALYTRTFKPDVLPRAAGLAAETVAEVLTLPESEIDIGRAALLVAREDRPDLDVDAYLRRLDETAARLRRRLPEGTTAAEAVRQTVAVVQPRSRSGRRPSSRRRRRAAVFDLSVRASDMPAKGLPPEIDLARILDGAEGNCLGLTLLYLAVAERAGLPLHGVSAPEHFFVRYDDGITRINVEPTRGGRTPVKDRAYIQSGRISRDSLDRGIHLRTESKRQVLASLLANRAGYRAVQGELAAAHGDALRALAVKPYWPQAYVNRGLVHELAGRAREAEADYRRALRLDPNCVGALNNLAALYSRGRAFGGGAETVPATAAETAEWMIRRAIRLAPTRPELHETAAAVAAARGQLRRARSRLRRAMALDPGDERYDRELRSLERRAGEASAASAD
jgi:regulator of sirC expression with transglutaminase-like and TPR domain